MTDGLAAAAQAVIAPSEWRRRRKRLDVSGWCIIGTVWALIAGVAAGWIPDGFAVSIISALIGAGVILLGMYFGGAVLDDQNQKKALASVVEKLAGRV